MSNFEAKNDDPETPEVGSDETDGRAEVEEAQEVAVKEEPSPAPAEVADENAKTEGENLMTKYPELREIAQSCIVVSKIGGESENESEEVDNIELIFTTGEALRDVGLQEDLVSITADNEAGTSSTSKNAEQDGAGASGSNDNNGAGNEGKSGSVEEAPSSKGSSIDREESVDRFDENLSSGRLSKMWSQCSVLVETDISKCGVVEEGVETSAKQTARRNTLAAPVQIYR